MQTGSGRFRPLHPKHAIERVSIQIAFIGNLPQADFASLASWRPIRAKLEPDLPAFQAENGLVVANPNTPQQHVQQGVSAVIFARIAPDGTPSCQLRVEPQSINFSTNVYTRWPSIRDEALKFISVVAEDYFFQQALSVAEVAIQYQNVFVWEGEASGLDPSLLLQAGSSWLVPRAVTQQQNWHCHYGELQRVNSNIRRLVHVHTAVVNQEGLADSDRAITLNLTLSDALNMPDYEPFQLPVGEMAREWVLERLENLHSYEKQVVGEIVDDQMQHDISLNAGYYV